MTITSEFIKQKAKEYGATICGVGNIELMRDEIPERNPFLILPAAKSIIGFGIKVPRGLYTAMENKAQYYNYTGVGVRYVDATFAEIFLFKFHELDSFTCFAHRVACHRCKRKRRAERYNDIIKPKSRNKLKSYGKRADSEALPYCERHIEA